MIDEQHAASKGLEIAIHTMPRYYFMMILATCLRSRVMWELMSDAAENLGEILYNKESMTFDTNERSDSNCSGKQPSMYTVLFTSLLS